MNYTEKAVSVYFDGNAPVGISEATAKNGKFDEAELYANSQPVTKEMLSEAGKKLQVDSATFTLNGPATVGLQSHADGKSPIEIG